MVTAVVRGDLVVRGPDVAPLWPHGQELGRRVPALRSAELLDDSAGRRAAPVRYCP